jgi:hypothetical protein
MATILRTDAVTLKRLIFQDYILCTLSSKKMTANIDDVYGVTELTLRLSPAA